jgi:hypothetical protein
MFRGQDRGGVRRGTARRIVAARLSVLIVALALGVAVAGCGSTKPLTRAQLVSHANALCTHVHAEVKNIGPAKTPQELVRLTRKLASFEQHALESMRSLKPPSALAADWKHMIEGAEEVAESAGTLSTDAQLKKEKGEREALEHIVHVEKNISPIVARDGFTSCKELI